VIAVLDASAAVEIVLRRAQANRFAAIVKNADMVLSAGQALSLAVDYVRAPLCIVMSVSGARRTERRNRSVQCVHEDFEHRSTKQLKRGINK